MGPDSILEGGTLSAQVQRRRNPAGTTQANLAIDGKQS
jgi:hypothetical protein